MSQYPPQGQQYPPDQPPWQRQQSQSLPPSQPSGQWQQPNTGYQSAPQYPEQWQQPMPSGVYPPQQQPMPSGVYPPQQQPGMYPPQQQPMQPGMYPPPQTPKKKSRLGLWIAFGVIAVLLLACGGIAAAINSGAKSVATVVATQVATTTTAQSQPTTASTNNQHFKVGQVVKVNDTWQVTINSVKTANGGDFSTPTAGDSYFIVDVTLKNLSAQAQDISSALNFSLQDATGQKYTETILIGETPPDGKVEASSLLRGQLTYEVPTSQKSFTFNFEPDIVAGNQTVWDLQR
ncbi:MAG: DUF4352 domain-containing protein [Ktedonobacteraceae bacterium]